METAITICWITYFFIILLAMIHALYVQHKLYRYIYEKHYEKWKHLTTIFAFGPGARNSIKGLKFLFSDEDFGDVKTKTLKTKTRYAILSLVVLFALIPFMITLSIIARFIADAFFGIY